MKIRLSFNFAKKLLICAIFPVLVILSSETAMGSATDSLLSELKKHEKPDTNRINILTALSACYMSNNVDSGILYANEALALAQKTGYKKGATNATETLGLAFLNKNEYDKALNYYNKALQDWQGIKYKPGIALDYCYIGNVYAHHQQHSQAIGYYKKSIELSREAKVSATEALAMLALGNLYEDRGDFTEALTRYLSAVEIFEREHNTEGISSCLSNIASTYSALGDYKKALDYNQQSKYLFLALGNKLGVVSSYLNLGVTYGQMQDFRAAIDMLTAGMKLADSIGNDYWKNICLANIGEAYFSLGSYDTAYEKYFQALQVAERINDNANIAQTNNGIGAILIKKGKLAEGIKHLLIAYEIMKNAGRKVPTQEIAMNLSNAYEKAHDYASALSYYKVYSAYADSLYIEKNEKQIRQLQFDYDLRKKETEINLLQKDKAIADTKSDKQTAIIWAMFTGLTLLVIISILLYRSRTYEKHSKDKIYRQKEEIQLQATKLEELNRFKDKTFSVLSHDLRGPIDSFSSIISMLDENIISQEEYSIMKPEMSVQIASLTILLDNLLKWASTYMKGQIAAIPVVTNIRSITRQNTKLLQSAANRKQINIIDEIPESFTARCDAGQMDIVIRNLLGNAIKFTRQGGAIKLTAQRDGNIIRISISDNGVGMTKEQLNKLFIIATENHTYGTDGEIGTGLGLLLCNEFVKANDGTIAVSSEINAGSTFTIVLMDQNL